MYVGGQVKKLYARRSRKVFQATRLKCYIFSTVFAPFEFIHCSAFRFVSFPFLLGESCFTAESCKSSGLLGKIAYDLH